MPGSGVGIDDAEEQSLFLSALTFGEIKRGIALLPPSRKRRRYERFLDMLGRRFHERILAFDRTVADKWGALLARCSLNGTPMPTIGSILAATALAHDLTLVTRNIGDFRHADVRLVNPFLLKIAKAARLAERRPARSL